MPASASGSSCHPPFSRPHDPAPTLPLRCCDDDNASVRAVGCTGRSGPVHPSARLVRSGNIVVTLNFATMILAGKQEGIRWP